MICNYTEHVKYWRMSIHKSATHQCPLSAVLERLPTMRDWNTEHNTMSYSNKATCKNYTTTIIQVSGWAVIHKYWVLVCCSHKYHEISLSVRLHYQERFAACHQASDTHDLTHCSKLHDCSRHLRELARTWPAHSSLLFHPVVVVTPYTHKLCSGCCNTLHTQEPPLAKSWQKVKEWVMPDDSHNHQSQRLKGWKGAISEAELCSFELLHSHHQQMKLIHNIILQVL